jgi:hypothetical protein
LGTSTNKWSKVYSDDVVHTTGNETISGVKTFSNLRTYFGRDISCYSTRKYGKNLNPESNTYQYLNFSGNTVSDGSTNDWSSGYLEQVVDTNGGSRGRWFIQDTSENPVGVELWASGNDKQFRPFQNNNTDLGTSTKKWKAVYSNAYYLGSTAFGDIVTYNAAEFVPRSGGAVMTGDLLASSTINSIGFGYGWGNGSTIYTYSPTHSTAEWQGTIRLEPLKTTSNFKTMQLAPDGTWTWSGTACQITSDQRYKQQITEIDDKLLDAWGDVELVQFKYNESVDTKGESARLHTGYVVQQIDSACKSHGIDVSAYGLYCHEQYPEETKEVEIEQADGTKTKETKVIREASEHYSLRYTEALIVECKYLRRCIARLTARIEELEKGNNSK